MYNMIRTLVRVTYFEPIAKSQDKMLISVIFETLVPFRPKIRHHISKFDQKRTKLCPRTYTGGQKFVNRELILVTGMFFAISCSFSCQTLIVISKITVNCPRDRVRRFGT